MPEFTGERLIPGQVDIDLLNEHLARYIFAVRLARGKRVLDAGCGAGYGAAELARVADSVVGADVAREALDFARSRYRMPNLRFEQASCAALPHPDGCFDLVVAFEVIEHLDQWREFLAEVRRILAPRGQLVVSTPNRLYYTESRGIHGANPFHVHEFEFAEFRSEFANPFHVHEFEFAEFRSELKAVFPDVALFLENHVAGVTIQPQDAGTTAEVQVDAGAAAPDDAHFFVAVCAHRPQIGNPTFVYIPRAANVLRERERHIGLQNARLTQLDVRIVELQEELERSNQWALGLNHEIEQRRARVVELQGELSQATDGYEAKIRQLEQELAEAAQWARNLETQLSLYRESRWVRFGRKIGFDPERSGAGQTGT